VQSFLVHWGYLALFLITALSAFGIPVGSELAMAYGGALASGQVLTGPRDHLSLGLVIGVAAIGELVGSLFGYGLGRFGGRPFVNQVGRYLLLTRRDLDRVEAFLARKGETFVLIGRLIPLLRSFVSIVAGLAEMTVWRFLAFSVIGCAIFTAAVSSIGYSLGGSWHVAVKDFSDAGYVAAGLAVLVIGATLIHRLKVLREEGALIGADTRQDGDLHSLVTRALATVKIDFAPTHKQPVAARLLIATITSLGGSLGADSLLVAIGTRVFPSTKGYVHFRFFDYGKLTTIGVIVACLAWPVVTRISSAPRWVFVRMAVFVTAVLWLPDLYILAKGQAPKAVLVLMVMHLAIGLVTYNALVRLAPTTTTRSDTPHASGLRHLRSSRRAWLEVAPSLAAGTADIAGRLERWTTWRADPSKTDDANEQQSQQLHREFVIALRFWEEMFNSWCAISHPSPSARRTPGQRWNILNVCFRAVLSAVRCEYTAYSLTFIGDENDETRTLGAAVLGQGITLYRVVAIGLRQALDGKTRDLTDLLKWSCAIAQQSQPLEAFDQLHAGPAAQLRAQSGL